MKEQIFKNYIKTKLKPTEDYKVVSFEDDGVIKIYSKDKKISGSYFVLPESFGMCTPETIVCALLFNCSSKWLEKYTMIDFRVLELIKDELGIIAYSKLITRAMKEYSEFTAESIINEAIYQYGMNYFNIEFFDGIAIYKLNTKVEY